MLQGCRANGEDAVQLVGWIWAVIPQVRVWMGAAQRTRILIGDKDLPAVRGFAQNRVKSLVFVGGLWEFGVTVGDGNLVPCADAGGIGMRQVRCAIRLQRDPRMWIVHNGGSGRDGAGGKIMCEAERVSYLVRGELADAR